MTPSDRIIVALDVPTSSVAQNLARYLAGKVGMFKIGLELFSRYGPDIVTKIGDLNTPVFLDLKLHDIPVTVERAARVLRKLPVSYATVHSSGGRTMMESAVRGFGGHVQALAVTVLTSLNRADLTELGIGPGKVSQLVKKRALMAKRAGCAGVICSPADVSAIRAVLPPPFLVVTPGIRLAGSSTHDQKRVGTPAEVVRAGADQMVVGRPIREAGDPLVAVAELCKEIELAEKDQDV